ncbi:MAG: ROK family protein [Nanoarchaeota archaeon]|nr:ROK family protein [Nanoarchaeota archaeon]
MKYFIGLDVGATKTEGVLINEKGKVFGYDKVLTKKTKKDLLEEIFSLIERLWVKKIYGIGIGVPGQIREGMMVSLHNLPKLKNLNLGKIVRKKFGVRTLIDNDANCFALAEARFQKKNNLVGLTLGSGVGGGIIIEGEIYHGKDGLAGEFGQIVYQKETFEDYCSGKFFKKNGFNKKSFEEYGFHLGNLINVVVNSVDPEIVVLGGSVIKSFGFFKSAMERRLKKSLTYSQLRKTKVVVSKVKYGGAIGAGLLLQNL